MISVQWNNLCDDNKKPPVGGIDYTDALFVMVIVNLKECVSPASFAFPFW